MSTVNSTTRNIQRLNEDTYEAEKRSRERISDAQRLADESIEDTQRVTEHTKSQLETQRLKDLARQEETAELERARGEEVLEDMRLSLSTEARRLHREGEKRIRDITEYFNEETNRIEYDAKQKEKQTLRGHAARIDHEEKMGRAQAEAAKSTYGAQLKNQIADHAQTLQNVREQYAAETDDLKLLTRTALDSAQQRYLDQHEKVLQQHQADLNHLQFSTEQRLKDIQASSAQRLNDFANRKSDPFYRVVNMDASIYDMGNAYVLEARIPEHEQDNVSISVTPGQITLTGKRRASDAVDLGPGRKITTSAFQSFTETFPISETVVARQLSKSFDGDRLTITIPKAGGTPAYSPFQRKA